MKYLFICGTARSGTTAMWRLLTSDERVVIGLERYIGLCSKHALTEELFSIERFTTLYEGDTFYQDLSIPYYKKVKVLLATADYVGDKIPMLFHYFDRLFTNIPTAKVIFMLRNIIDVASSYEARANDNNDTAWTANRRTAAAIKDWHQSLLVLQKYSNDSRVFPIIYEDFFSTTNSIEALYQFLQLEPNHAVQTRYDAVLSKSSQLEKQRKRELTIDAVQQICETAPFELYRDVLKEIRTKQNS